MTEDWVDCLCHTHEHGKIAQNKYMPISGEEIPLDFRKGLSLVGDVLSDDGKARATEKVNLRSRSTNFWLRAVSA